MNAYELADKLEEWYNYSHENMCNEAATMLRQQQEQIDKLTAIVALREMNIKQQQAELDVLKERNRFLESFYRTVKAQEK
jgi:PIN domain nuclease of toxin-antitoxin system